MPKAPPPSGAAPRDRPFKLAVAFACIYLVWGSTYLAIRFGIETIPPFAMAAVRFLLAGGLLFVWLAIRGELRRATPAEWRAAWISGGLFFVGGNGGVCWAEQRVPSGIAALVVSTIPVWIVLLDWMRPGGTRPSLKTAAGMILGFLGVALLAGPTNAPGGALDPASVIVLILAEISWAAGTVYTRHAPTPRSHLQSTAMQMLAGGVLLTLVGALLGDWRTLNPSAVSHRSIVSVAYLVLFGSIVAFSAYNWLVHTTTPARVGTYAYVNPGIAVLLGWGFAGESISPRVLLAGAAIVVSVIMILGPPSTTRSRDRSSS